MIRSASSITFVGAKSRIRFAMPMRACCSLSNLISSYKYALRSDFEAFMMKLGIDRLALRHLTRGALDPVLTALRIQRRNEGCAATHESSGQCRYSTQDGRFDVHFYLR